VLSISLEQFQIRVLGNI